MFLFLLQSCPLLPTPCSHGKHSKLWLRVIFPLYFTCVWKTRNELVLFFSLLSSKWTSWRPLCIYLPYLNNPREWCPYFTSSLPLIASLPSLCDSWDCCRVLGQVPWHCSTEDRFAEVGLWLSLDLTSTAVLTHFCLGKALAVTLPGPRALPCTGAEPSLDS